MAILGQINSNTDLAKGDVHLSNVDDTTDMDKPISSAAQAALNLKANAGDDVTLATTQTITGEKTFDAETTFGRNGFKPVVIRRIDDTALANGLRCIKGRGTVATPAGVQSGDQVTRLMAHGYIDDGTLPATLASESFIVVSASENWTATARGRTLDIRTIANGSINGVSRILIDSSGNVTISGTLTVNTGATGSFTAQSGEVVTVTKGIVTSIV
jgi:hypothetical protein